MKACGLAIAPDDTMYVGDTDAGTVAILKNGKVFSFVAVIVLLYAFKTETRNPVWKDNYTLFSNDV